jgi:hypothetical protein
MNMEDMVACKLYTGRFSKTLSIANDAVVITVLSKSGMFVLLNAVWMKTWEALLLIRESTACMVARKHLIATFVHHFNTSSCSANIAESRF